jgi:outer membrane protein assembly factor BamB
LLWSQESKEHYDFLSTSPVVAQGMVYVAGGDGGITALDAASGQKKWERSTLPTGQTPTVANGVLFLPTVEGELDALDASSGQVKWQAVHGEGFTSSPVVVGNTIYIYSYAGVFAMDRASGKDRWFRKMNGTLAALIVVNNAIYMVAGDRNWKPNGLSLGPDNQELDVLDASTGSDLWYYPLSGLSFSTPAVSGGVAYVGAGDGKMYALLPPE